MISRMQLHHIHEVVQVHNLGFPGFFLTFLGSKFLNVYYEGIVRHDSSVKLIYFDGGKITGFVVGVVNPSGFYSSLVRKDWYRFGLASLPAVVKKPRSVFRLLRAISRARTAPKREGITELTSIAVLPGEQKRGIGKDLVRAFIDEAGKIGGKSVYLTTDAHCNDGVNAFYIKFGFRLSRVFETPEKRVMNEYIIDIC